MLDMLNVLLAWSMSDQWCMASEIWPVNFAKLHAMTITCIVVTFLWRHFYITRLVPSTVANESGFHMTCVWLHLLKLKLILISGSLNFDLQLLKKRCMNLFCYECTTIVYCWSTICQSLVLGPAWDSEMCFVNCKNLAGWINNAESSSVQLIVKCFLCI